MKQRGGSIPGGEMRWDEERGTKLSECVRSQVQYSGIADNHQVRGKEGKKARRQGSVDKILRKYCTLCKAWIRSDHEP